MSELSAGTYHPRANGASRLCPLCGGKPDRLGLCDRGHPQLRLTGISYVFKDFRDNLIADVDAPVLHWRQERGHRLGYENSHEALAWNLFRGLELLGGLRTGLASGLAVEDTPEAWFWARGRDGAPWRPFSDARAALEEHIRGPDACYAEPDLVLVDRARRQVLFIDASVASSVTCARAPRWFAAAAKPSEQRRRRAILEGLTSEEDPAPFGRGLAEMIRRGYYRLARRFLLARAAARRLGEGWTGRLVCLVNPPTMRRATEEAARFGELITPALRGHYLATSWAALAAGVPSQLRAARCEGLRRCLDEYLRSRTINRLPAGMLAS